MSKWELVEENGRLFFLKYGTLPSEIFETDSQTVAKSLLSQNFAQKIGFFEHPTIEAIVKDGKVWSKEETFEESHKKRPDPFYDALSPNKGLGFANISMYRELIKEFGDSFVRSDVFRIFALHCDSAHYSNYGIKKETAIPIDFGLAFSGKAYYD